MTRRYEVVPGYFIQDTSDPGVLPAIPQRFGLADESPERWTSFVAQIKKLNDLADARSEYKVFFLGRHGEGFHNFAISKYGSKAWDNYWSKLDTDGEITWGPDPELTQLGIEQAMNVQQAWKDELPFGLPLPDRLYCSPLTRAMKTCEITFHDTILNDIRKVMVSELCREENGVHTCDKRNVKQYIEKAFPLFEIEDGFTEEDELWDPNIRETRDQVVQRAKAMIDTIFETDTAHTFISITAHSGFIQGFMKAVNKPIIAIPIGGVLPVVVKARLEIRLAN
ncbi:hypothetical protein AMATHDRAFT_187957 [Amanita thiersii Skay4041]|uniref:Phosphoglycerate mutase n=1 Tax=Amanita thiersii Skay4041 TaxID=703135 RepID=A0A2A9NVC1_9AGAR|nr:hypothetical protein AMATHDRAFT_187957 [Amanita thiersii Skay4041]